jgi:hypothetical protein
MRARGIGRTWCRAHDHAGLPLAVASTRSPLPYLEGHRLPMPRRFPSPWSAERIPGGHVVKDAVCYASGIWTHCMPPSRNLPLMAIHTSSASALDAA